MRFSFVYTLSSRPERVPPFLHAPLVQCISAVVLKRDFNGLGMRGNPGLDITATRRREDAKPAIPVAGNLRSTKNQIKKPEGV